MGCTALRLIVKFVCGVSLTFSLHDRHKEPLILKSSLVEVKFVLGKGKEDGMNYTNLISFSYPGIGSLILSA